MSKLEAIRARAQAYADHGTPGLAAPKDRADLLAIIDAVKALADGWEARGEYDMKFSKTLPDEDIAMAILTDGAQKVENARKIRNALEGA